MKILIVIIILGLLLVTSCTTTRYVSFSFQIEDTGNNADNIEECIKQGSEVVKEEFPFRKMDYVFEGVVCDDGRCTCW